MIRKQFTKGMITSPYAHSDLVGGEAGSSNLGKQNVDILLLFIAFREREENAKHLRGLSLVAMDGSRWTSDYLRQQKA